MANLTEASTWEAGVYQIEVTDRVSGGSDGVANIQPRQLGNRTKYLKDTLDGVVTSIGLKAPIASPTFTGTVSGITKTMVGLANVDNTADANKSVASAATLTTPRNINGVAFNGSADITVGDSTKAPLNGTGASGTWAIAITGNAATASTAAACSGNAATATTAAACSGNAATATYATKAGDKTAYKQEFNTSGTWVCPAEVNLVFVHLIGGGGQGGPATSESLKGGGGGGAGAEKKEWVNVTPGVTYTIVIGAGGNNTVRNSTDSLGYDGDSSQFKQGTTVLLNAYFGWGGHRHEPSYPGTIYTAPAGRGYGSNGTNPYQETGGHGGSTTIGIGGSGGDCTDSSTPTDGFSGSYGAGGGGAGWPTTPSYTCFLGGAGGDGYCELTWFV